MKLLNYYIAILAPLLISLILLKFGFVVAFAVSLVFYYIYRCFLDYYKLKRNGVVSSKDYWKFIIPVWTFIYFDELYFK